MSDLLRLLAVLIIGAVLGTAAASLIYVALATIGWWPTGETASYYTALLLGAGGAMAGEVGVTWIYTRRMP
jgi:hypothetical protein